MVRVFAARLSLLAALFVWFAACTPLITTFDVEAYKTATALKAETLALVDKSNEPFASRKKDVEALTAKINAAYEYAAGLPNNQLSTQQWQLLRNPEGHLYGSFVRSWQRSGRLSDGFRSEKKLQLASAFDAIICLEANKKESKACVAVAASTGTR